MAPRLRNAVLPNITNYSTWTAISNAAIAIEESVSLDDNILEEAFARLSLNPPATTNQPSNSTSPFHYPAPEVSTSQFGSSPTPAAPVAPALGPNDMKIDALQHRSNGRFNQRNTYNRSSGASRTKPRQQRDSMRLWSDSGKPICGYCKKEGHLTTKCRSRSRSAINSVSDVTPATEQSSQSSVCYLQPSSDIEYAAVPIEDDPFTHTINNLEVSTSSTTPKIKVTLNGHLVTALVDTGASISAIRSSLAAKLGLIPDNSKSIAFTNADNHSTTSRGIVKLATMIGDVSVKLTYHAIDSLFQQVILGYPDLKQLKATIDTTSNEVRICKAPGSQVSSGPTLSAPMVCSMVSSVRLPGQHHAYVDIQGPPNSAAFVSTPSELVLKKFVSVAAGIVNFDENGKATVKIANLDKNIKHVNKGQYIANYEYLSPSLRVHSDNSNKPCVNHLSNVSSSSTKYKPAFDPHIGTHLSPLQRTAMTNLLQEASGYYMIILIFHKIF